MKTYIEQIIKELATQNFNSYPESYPVENGFATDEASSAAQDLARSYFENRTENDVERDETNGVTETDYVEWVMVAFGEWVREMSPELDKFDKFVMDQVAKVRGGDTVAIDRYSDEFEESLDKVSDEDLGNAIRSYHEVRNEVENILEGTIR